MQQKPLKTDAQMKHFFSCRTHQRLAKSSHSQWARLGSSLCVSILLVACANLSPSTPETKVRQRANERWQALVAGEFDRAYSYHTPSFKAVVSPTSFKGRIGNAGSWIGAEVVDVNCPEKIKCIARVRIDFKPVLTRRFGDKISTHADETWLLEGGRWWIFQAI